MTKPSADAPTSLLETLNQASEALDREADACMEVFQRRSASNPASAIGFQKRGMFISRQYKRVNQSYQRIVQINSIMENAYSMVADAEGMIDLNNLLIDKSTRTLLTNVCEHAVIPSTIHVLAIGNLYKALIRYPM